MPKEITLTKQYTPYDRYTDSGVEWFGQVPEGWDVLKLKQFAEVITGNTPSKSDEENYSKDGIPWIKPDNLNEFEPIKNTKDRVSKKGTFSSRLVPEKSILVNGIGDIGKIGINEVPAFTNQQINSIILNKKKVHFDFGKYVVYSSKEELQANSNKVVVPILNKSQQKNISYPIPPLSIQQRIATYLDEKTEKIDKIIAGKKRLVELLEEKRKSVISEAVEGVGNEVKRERLKFIAPLRNSKIAQQNVEERYVGLEHISSWKGTLLNIQGGQQSAEGIVNRFKNGDVLFGKLRPYLAKAFVADFQGVCTGELLVMTPDKAKILPKYLLNIVLSEKFLDMVNNSTYGAKMPRASWDFIGNIEIEYPSLEQQEKIVAQLDEQLTKIDNLIKKVNQSITLLTEYKSSLISHVVTGRVKV